MIERSLEDYQEALGIYLGMSKQEAFENFRVWQETKKTCQRCEGEKYKEYCPFHLICKQAEEEKDDRDAERDGNRGRVVKADEPERVRVSLSEERERSSLR